MARTESFTCYEGAAFIYIESGNLSQIKTWYFLYRDCLRFKPSDTAIIVLCDSKSCIHYKDIENGTINCLPIPSSKTHASVCSLLMYFKIYDRLPFEVLVDYRF